MSWSLGTRDGFNVCTVHEGKEGVASVFGLPINCRVDDPDLADPMWAKGLERGRLIAAAPDMFEALSKIKALTEPGQELDVSAAVDLICEVWHETRAALSKALSGDTV